MAAPWEKYQPQVTPTTKGPEGPWGKYQAAPVDLGGGAPSGMKPVAAAVQEHWTDNIRDPLAGVLKIGPTAVKGVADVARLLTNDAVGVDTSNYLQGAMQSIDDVVGSERLRAQQEAVSRILQSDEFSVKDIPGMLVDNPRAAINAGISTIGSMFVPAGAAAGAVRGAGALANAGKVGAAISKVAPATLATGTTIGTSALMNAGETFADSEGGHPADRYKGAALSGGASLVLGKLLGGGAEGLVARRLAGELGKDTAKEVAKSALKSAATEGVQEFGEEGANTIGKQLGNGQDIDLNAAAKSGAYGAAIGSALGASTDLSTNARALKNAPAAAPAIDPNAPAVDEPAAPRQNLSDRLDALASRMESQGKTDEAREYRVQAQTARMVEADPEGARRLLQEAQANDETTSQQTDPAQAGQAPAAMESAAAQPELPAAGTAAVEAAGLKPQDGPVLQNRDRSTTASITQMQSIAADPDYGRLSYSRDFANGAPVVAGGQVDAQHLGRADYAAASDGRRIPVQYAVVEADSVLPSNSVDGTPNVEYGRSSAVMRAIAGNGRIAGLQAAALRGSDTKYRGELASDTLHGVDPQVIAGMRAPVLVRVMPQDQVTDNIGDVSNTSGNLSLSAVEQASNDGQRVDLSALEFAEDGGVTAQAVRQFVQGMPQAEIGQLLDTNGQPTKQAVDRLHAAVFSRAYGNDGLVRLYAQAQDPEARMILSALAKLAPKMARLEGAGALDIREVVTQAAEIAVNARRNGTPLAQAAAQLDMAADPLVGKVLQLFAANPRSNKQVIEQLGNLADLAYSEANQPSENLFGPVERATREQVMQSLGATNERASAQNLEQPQGAGTVSDDAQRAATTAAPADTGRAEAGRPAEGASRASDGSGADSETVAPSAQPESTPVEKQSESLDSQAQDAIKNESTAESPQKDYADGQAGLFSQTDTGKQLGLWLDSKPDPSQTGARVDAVRSAAAKAVEDIHDTDTLLGLALSRDYAARQRVSLVGQTVENHWDLALLAQVYRDPRFETFRLVFVNDAGAIVSQVGLTSRLPAAAVAVVGSDVNAYLADISKAARNSGASGFYMLHNHPSGESAASSADQRLTVSFARNMPELEFKKHIVIDTNEYTVIDEFGLTSTFKEDFGQFAPLTYGEFGGKAIRGPSDVMDMAKRMEVTSDAVSLITLDAQLRVRGVTSVPADAFSADKAATKRAILKATLRQQGGRVVAVGRNPGVLRRANGMVVDAVWVKSDGSVQSMGETGGIQTDGELFPEDRRPRLSADSSKAFEYLREQTAPAVQGKGQKVAEDQASYDEATGLPLNPDGTVTVYHHTSAAKAQQIRASGRLKSAGEPDVYVTTWDKTDTGYGDTAVAIQVDPELLMLDDEFPNGRMDFRIDTGKPGGSVAVKTAARVESPQASYGDQTQTPAFKRWFGDSGVRDENGEPKLFYHGGSKDFSGVHAGGRFGGAIFVRDGRESGYGQSQHALYLNSPILELGEMRDLLDGNQQVLADVLGHDVDPDVLNMVSEALTDGSHYPDSQEVWDAIGAIDEADAQLEIQKLRGVVARELGFKAVRTPDEFDGETVMVLSPGAIKSATNNNGEFDSENPSIVRSPQSKYRSTTGGNANALQSSSAPWTVPEPGTLDNWVRALQNNKIDLKRVRDVLEGKYGQLSDRQDAYLNEELYHGRVAARVTQLHDEVVKPMLAKIAVAGKNAGVTVDDVNLYLHARHAPERNAAMKEINPDMANNEALSGMSDQEAASAIARFRADGKLGALQTIAADVDGLIGDTRTSLVADGLEDADVVQAWENKYKHYVPLQRDFKEQGGGAKKGMGFSVRGPEAKSAVGSNREVVNILANIVASAETAAIRAEKTRVGRSLLQMAQAHPNKDFWTVDTPPTKPRIDKDTGLVIRSAVDPMYQTKDNVLMLKDQHGKEHFVVFNEHNERAMAVAKAMKNIDIASVPKAIEIVGKGTRFLASMLTARNPEFWITNFARDIQGALLNLEGTSAEGLQSSFLRNMKGAFKGMHSLVRGDGTGVMAQVAREMQEAGGTTGYMQAFENSDDRMGDLRKEVARMQQGKADPRRLGRTVLDFIEDYNDIIENAVRLAAYKTARDAGASIPRSASLAKNITVNFNRKGNQTPVINSLYMFFNASIQGTTRMLQAVGTSRKAQAIVGGIAGMGFLLDIVNRMIAGDDDETGRNRYDMIPEFEKSKNWIFMNPWEPGKYVKVPLPMGPHIFHNAGRLVADAANRKDPRNTAEYAFAFAGTMFDAFSPLGGAQSLSEFIAPSVFDPAIQLENNKSFTGGPVYKSADQGFGKMDPKPAFTRHFESTPDVWVGASRLLNSISGGDDVKPGRINIEPDILKHITYTFTGGPGRSLDQTADMVQGELRGEKVEGSRYPFVRRFYGENDDRQRSRIFYDDQKRVVESKTQYDYFVKQGRRDLAKEVATDLGEGDYQRGMKLMRDFKGSARQLQKINAQIKREELRSSKGEDRSKQIKTLRERRGAVMSGTVRRNTDTEDDD